MYIECITFFEFVWIFSVTYIDTSSATLGGHLIINMYPISVHTVNTTLLRVT